MELASWSFKPDPMTKVDSKTKTALTNAYKKSSVALPYFVDDKPVKKRMPIRLDFEEEDATEEVEEPEEEVAVKPKRVIKVANQKPPAKKKKTQNGKPDIAKFFN